MAKIKSLILENFKGKNCTRQLTGKDIYIGNNGVGKSTNIEAVVFSILGYIPEAGKVLENNFSYSSNSSKFLVGLSLDNGFSFNRGIKKTSQKYSEIIELSSDENTIKEKRERIKKEIGDFPIVLDFDNFISKTDSEKRKYIYDLLGNKWDKSRVAEYVKNKIKEIFCDEELEEANPVIDVLMQGYNDTLSSQDCIKKLIDLNNEKLSYWKEQKKQLEGTISKLSEYKNDENFVNPNAIEQELDKINMSILNLEKELAVSSNNTVQLESKSKKINSLLIEIDKINKLLESNKLDLNINQLKNQIETISKTMYSNEEMTKESCHLNEINKCISDIDEKIANLNHTLVKVVSDGKAKAAEIKTYQDLLKKINQHQGVCVINSKIKCNKDFTPFINHVNQKVSVVKNNTNALREDFKKIKKEINSLENQKSDLINKSKFLNEKIIRVSRSNNEVSTKILNLNNEINAITNKKKSFLDKIINYQKIIDENKKDIENLSKGVTDTKVILQEIDQLKIKAVSLKEKQKQANKINLYRRDLKKSSIERSKAEMLINIHSCLQTILGAKGLQGEILKDGLQPLEDQITQNLKTLGVNKKFFFQCNNDKGKEIFKFGWINNRKRICFNTLSDGEKSMLLIALLVALIERKQPNVKMLCLDKIEAIDSDNLEKIIEGLNKLSSKLDNIILCGRMNDSIVQISKKNNFNVINLNQ